MSRTEFLEALKNQLNGQMQDERVAAHVRYYEDYIQSQVRSGRSETEVLEELGDPRLIAKTLLDTAPASDTEVFEEEQRYYGSVDENAADGAKTVRRLDLSSWYGKLIVIIAAVLIIVLLVTVLTAVLPFFLVLALILFVVSRFKNK